MNYKELRFDKLKEWNVPKAYIPKTNSEAVDIPKIGLSQFEIFFQQQTPFILEYSLEHELEAVLLAIDQVPKNLKVRTFDSIPFKEIREGNFSDYVDYASSNSTIDYFPNSFEIVEKKEGLVSKTEFRHYALSLNEGIFPIIKDFRFPFVNNFLLNISQQTYLDKNIISPHWLFIHPLFSVSNAHFDHNSVHTLICQLKGKKYAYLLSPLDHEQIKNPDFPMLPNRFNDLTREEIETMPLKDLKTWEGVVEENNILFIPQNWVHFVLGLEPGISYSQDIVQSNNFDSWLRSL